MSEPLSSVSPENYGEVFAQLLQEEKERERQNLIRGADPQVSFWMAMVPSMTIGLASSAGLPVASGDVGAAFQAMLDQGLLELRGTASQRRKSAGEPVYRMTRAGRAQVLGAFLERDEGQREVTRMLSEVGAQVSKAAGSGAPAHLRRWAELAARASDSSALVEFFDERVRAAFEARDPGELLSWIETARPMAALLEKGLEFSMGVALQRAGRRLELLHRRNSDERHLARFLRREDQIAALHELIEDPGSAWALHLIGGGGVGKTMLLRFLTGRLAPDEWNASVARIDFDYLNSDYPRLAPGLLLWSFAQELRAFDTTSRANELFNKADRYLRDLHGHLGSRSASTESSSTEDPRFRDALVPYIDALRALPQPVVLILDTCEELAKMRPDGDIPENVRETFRILRALHDGPNVLADEDAPSSGGLESLRVVFAGRRALAQSGYGWSCPSSGQPARSYLRAFELRGFTHDEARTYLRNRAGVPEGLVEAVIERSRDVADPSGIEWEDPARTPARVPRCNPYDLNLFGDWAREDPPPSAETIRSSSSDQYVELRILQRIDYEPLKALLPAVAQLKHVDRPLLEALLGPDTSVLDQLFEEVQAQEWIEVRQAVIREGTETRIVLSAKEGLRRRLTAYYREHGGVGSARLARAVEHLERATLESDLSELDWTTIDAALRCLQVDPARAAAWWERLERRVLDARGFDWLLKATENLLAEDNAAALVDSDANADDTPTSPLRPRILASHAAALLHAGEEHQAQDAWKEVSATAGAHPDPAGARRLRRRAVARLAAASTQAGEVDTFWEDLREADAGGELDVELAAAYVAGAERLLDHAERRAADRCEPASWPKASAGIHTLAERLSALASEPTGPAPLRSRTRWLAAYASGVAGRAAALLDRRYQQADRDYRRALGSLYLGGDQSFRWLDWLPPEDAPARVRLEALRSLHPAHLTASGVLGLVGSRPEGWGTNPEQARLTAARFAVEAALSPLPKNQRETLNQDLSRWIEELREAEASSPLATPPTCEAHRATPPPFVVAAEVAAAEGDVEMALGVLRAALSRADVLSLEDLRHVDRALARVTWRLRLGEDLQRGGVTLVQSEVVSDRFLLWAVAAQEGARAEQEAIDLPDELQAESSKRSLHDYLRTRFTLAGDGKVRMAETVSRFCTGMLAATSAPPEEASYGSMSLWLDACEAKLIGLAVAELETLGIEDLVGPATSWIDAHPDRPEEAVRLFFRAQALSRPPGVPMGTGLEEQAGRLGHRRFASIVFEEADLLGLRLPAEAGACMTLAVRLFAAIADPIGMQLASVRALLLLDPRDAQARNALERVLNDQGFSLRNVTGEPVGGRAWEPWRRRVRVAARMLESSSAVDSDEIQRAAGSAAHLSDFAPLLLRVQVVATPESPAGASAPAGAPAARPAAISWLTEFAKMAAGLAILFLTWYAQYRLMRWVGELVFGPLDLAWWRSWLLYGMALPIFAVLAVAQKGLIDALLASIARVALRIEPSTARAYRSQSSRTDVRATLEVALAQLRFKKAPWLRFVARDPIVLTCEVGGVEGYSVQAQGLLEPLTAALGPLTVRARNRHFRVWVVGDEDAHGPAWEALVHESLEPKRAPASARALVVRTTLDSTVSEKAALERRGFARRIESVQCWTGNESDSKAATVAWAGVILRKRLQVSFLQESASDDSHSPRQDEGADVLHLFSRVVETPAGLQLELSPDAGPRMSKDTGSVESDRFRANRSGQPADAIARRFRQKRVCILQGSIVRSEGQRSSSDRHDAILMRRFAAQLLALGFPVVLTIPPLRAGVAVPVAARFAELVRRHPRVPRKELERCVLHMRKLIAAGATDGSAESLAAAREQALDVCLYSIPSSRDTVAPREEESA